MYGRSFAASHSQGHGSTLCHRVCPRVCPNESVLRRCSSSFASRLCQGCTSTGSPPEYLITVFQTVVFKVITAVRRRTGTLPSNQLESLRWKSRITLWNEKTEALLRCEVDEVHGRRTLLHLLSPQYHIYMTIPGVWFCTADVGLSPR